MTYTEATDFICTYRTVPNGIRYAQGEMYDKEMAERLEALLIGNLCFHPADRDAAVEAIEWLIKEHRKLHEILETLHGDEGILEKHKLELETKDDEITDLRDGLDAIKKLIESYKGSNLRRKDGRIVLDADDVELILEHCQPKVQD